MEPVELTSDRLHLRIPTEADVDDITQACQDELLQRFIPVPVPYLREHGAGWVADTPQSWAEDQEYRWVVTEPAAATEQPGRVGAGPVVLGAIGLHPRDETMREIGFWTAPWARNRGITTDAVRLVCRFGFEVLRLGRIEWWANVGNDGSRRVAEKAGFTMEGTCRARLLHRGERVDGWVGGLLPGELR